MIILERFEGAFAIVEIDGDMIEIEKHKVSQCVKEGDILEVVDGIYYKDQKATEKRTKYIEDKYIDIWED